MQDPDHEITLKEAHKYDPEAAHRGRGAGFPSATDVLGRIAAQTAKQVIFQKVREAERDTVFAEYNQRVGELVNCTVKRLEGSGRHCGPGPHRSAHAAQGAVAPGDLSDGRPHCAL